MGIVICFGFILTGWKWVLLWCLW